MVRDLGRNLALALELEEGSEREGEWLEVSVRSGCRCDERLSTSLLVCQVTKTADAKILISIKLH